MGCDGEKKIAVFFTHGVSLELWDKRGMFSREVRFYQELAQQVGEVIFFTYGRNDKQYQEKLGARIHLFQKQLPIPNLLYGLLLPFLFWKQIAGVDMLRIHQMAGSIPALIAHWVFRKPLIVRCGYQWSTFLNLQNASRIKQWIVEWIERISYKTADAIIVTTQRDARQIEDRYEIPKQKINTISNFVDTDLFKPLMIEKEKNSVCFVGRLEPQKNLHSLVEAMKSVDARLVLYGEGSLRESLENSAREHGVDIEFRGRIANEMLPQALNACEIFILPSFHEGNPKVLLEAMACGLPVIGTRVEGIESIVEHNYNGLLCATDANSIQQTIVSLLNDPQNQIRLGKSARELILSACSLLKAIEREQNIMQAL
jgi:glycosyltransferase involved in cell wall biosynthesis